MKAKLYKWYIRREGLNDDWFAEREDGRRQMELANFHFHCKACAMAAVIEESPSADCDLRAFRDSPCYQWLAAQVRRRRAGED